MLATQGEEWKRQWLAEGRAEGETKGEARALVRLLERRFGALPQERRQQIAAADQTAVEVWLDRVLDAPTLEAVFDAQH